MIITNQATSTSDFVIEKDFFEEDDLPDDGIPQEIKNILCQLSSLSEVNKLSLLNKKWACYIGKHKNIFWSKILKKLNTSPVFKRLDTSPLSMTGSINQIIFATKNHIQTIFSQRFKQIFPVNLIKESFKDELEYLLANIELKNVFKLQEICHAVDVLIFWKALLCNPYVGSQINVDLYINNILNLHIKNIQELFDLASAFKKWCAINQDMLSKITYFNLVGCRMTSIPDEIELLKNLKSIDLSQNELVSLTPKIGQLKNLETLYLDKNSLLATLPNEIGQLKNLKSIDLSSVPLISLPGILKTNNVEIVIDEEQIQLLEEKTFWTYENDENDVYSDQSTFQYLTNTCLIQ
jgi:Leucine-rich repeat (LRR) protein